MRVKLPSLGVDVWFGEAAGNGNGGGGDDDDKAVSLRLAIRAALVSYQRNEHLHSTVDLGIAACSLRDCRPGKLVQTLIAPPVATVSTATATATSTASAAAVASSSDEETPQIVIYYANRQELGSSMNVVFNNLSINVAYDPLLHLAIFMQLQDRDDDDEEDDDDADGEGVDDDDETKTPSPKSGTDEEKIDAASSGMATMGAAEKNETVTTAKEATGASEAEAEAGVVAEETPTKFKVLLHHPTVAFWEDEASPASRVLLLRGLCVVDFSRSKEEDCERRVERLSARLDKLESFIMNRPPPTASATGFDDDDDDNDDDDDDNDDDVTKEKQGQDLGQKRKGGGKESKSSPSTASWSEEERVSPGAAVDALDGGADAVALAPDAARRRANVEPITLRCSYVDIQVLAAVARGWSSASSPRSTRPRFRLRRCTGGPAPQPAAQGEAHEAPEAAATTEASARAAAAAAIIVSRGQQRRKVAFSWHFAFDVVGVVAAGCAAGPECYQRRRRGGRRRRRRRRGRE